ncbi:hypothetical protein IDG68_14770, partial [Staphylococcus sp. EG-SA-21]|nr:hypothetical protein [Staphylococcus sp. EG-SA-21]
MIFLLFLQLLDHYFQYTYKNEHEYLKQLLKMSYERIKNQCGVFELENLIGQELILIRARYAYQD